MTYVLLPFHDCKFKHFSLKRNAFTKKRDRVHTLCLFLIVSYRCLLKILLHLLEVSILDVVILWSFLLSLLLTAERILRTSLCTLSTLVHLL